MRRLHTHDADAVDLISHHARGIGAEKCVGYGECGRCRVCAAAKLVEERADDLGRQTRSCGVVYQHEFGGADCRQPSSNGIGALCAARHDANLRVSFRCGAAQIGVFRRDHDDNLVHTC